VKIYAHLSDTHLDGGERALTRTRRVMAGLRAMPLEAILVTGDIADHGTMPEYDQAVAELVADVPGLVLPGNHDERTAFRAILLGEDARADPHEPVNRAVQVGNTLFALCDSSIPGRSEGALAPQTLDWLAEVLRQGDGPAFVCLHHPPVRTQHPLMDEILLTQPEQFAAVLADHPRVVAVLCGHAHMAVTATFAGRPVVVAPGVASTLRPHWTVPGPLTWDNAADRDAPPGVAFHLLDDGGQLTTQIRTVPLRG
jgi:3',5'-cyclic-AMP phosphodiesterase